MHVSPTAIDLAATAAFVAGAVQILKQLVPDSLPQRDGVIRTGAALLGVAAVLAQLYLPAAIVTAIAEGLSVGVAAMGSYAGYQRVSTAVQSVSISRKPAAPTT